MGTKHILSIDGGGIRGLIPAKVLTYIEERTGRPIVSLFDLVGGTSTGGLLGMALSMRGDDGEPQYKAHELVALYQDRGGDIFSSSFAKKISSGWGVLDEKYSEKGLEKTLKDFFADKTLGDCIGKCFVTAYDIEQRTPVFLKSWREHHQGILAREACRATSAAPTYFEPAKIFYDGRHHALVDGGICVNNPAVSAYAEGVRCFPGETIKVLSLGTGEATRPIHYKDARNWGQLEWMLPLLSCAFDGMSDVTDYQLQHSLGDNYLRLQVSLNIASDDMDDVSAENMQHLLVEADTLIKQSQTQIDAFCDALIADNQVA